VVVHTGFYRPNLHLDVIPAQGDGAKRGRLLEFLGRTDGSGIIYVATVKAVEELTDFLRACGQEAAGYHGRMAARKRTEAQDRFMDDRTRVMVATNAFGMGIDKPDLRFVLHYHLPGTLEEFYQEFGRAGRDGRPARCTLLHDPADRKLQRFFQARRYPDDSDLVNAHHALRRLADRPVPPTLEEVRAISPLSPSRLRVCLELMLSRGIVRRVGRSRYRLARPDMTREELARAGQSYKERDERDRDKQEQMVRYAEQRTCRWQRVLAYFGDEVLADGRCGHCDGCPA
jgi:ATP-dependent DNA helicase RecQ